MIISSLKAGFVSAKRNYLVAIASWFARLLLLVPATISFFAWWLNALQYRPNADVLLKRFDLGTLIDMVENDRNNVWMIFVIVVLATAFVGVVVNALLAGGILEVLVKGRSFSQGFFHGAGHFFWRNLQLLFVTAIVASLALGVVTTALNAALEPFDDSLSLVLDWISLLTPLFIGGLVALFFFAFVLDYARIDLVRSNRRNVLRAWWNGFKLALHRFWTTLFIWAFVAMSLCVLVAALIAVRSMLDESQPSVIVTIFVVQQLVFLLGSWLRIAVLAAEVNVSFSKSSNIRT